MTHYRTQRRYHCKFESVFYNLDAESTLVWAVDKILISLK